MRIDSLQHKLLQENLYYKQVVVVELAVTNPVSCAVILVCWNGRDVLKWASCFES